MPIYWIEEVKEVTKYKKFDWIDAVFTVALLISMATLFVFSLVYWN